MKQFKFRKPYTESTFFRYINDTNVSFCCDFAEEMMGISKTCQEIIVSVSDKRIHAKGWRKIGINDIYDRKISFRGKIHPYYYPLFDIVLFAKRNVLSVESFYVKFDGQ